MKRNYPVTSEENKNGDNGNKQWCPPSTSSDPNSTSETQPQPPPKLAKNQANDTNRSEAAALPTTTTPLFPWTGTSFNRGSELYNADSSQNPYMMPFGRNCTWSDNRIFGLPLADPNMTVNSTVMPFLRNENVASLNRRELESQGSSKDSQVPGRSPSPLPEFSTDEVERVNEMLKDKNLRQGLKILTGWLKRFECTKSNNNDFTDMIKYAHNQVWRLMSEKTEIKEELNEEKREISRGLNNIASQFTEICKVLQTSKLQKVWDQFTKPQRKNIRLWDEESQQLRQVLMNQQEEDDEDVNDDDIHRSPDSSEDHEKAELKKEYQKLKEQLNNLQSQFLAIDNENQIILNEKQVKVQEFENSKASLQEKCQSLDASIAKLKNYKMDALASTLKKNEPKNLEQAQLCPIQTSADKIGCPDGIEIKQREVYLLTLISTFLYVHPFGASLDYICSYLNSFAPYLNTRYLESLLTKFPDVFKEKKRGIGASLSRNWYFMGFKENK